MPCGLPEIQAAITSETVGSCSYIQDIEIITARSHTAWANYAFIGVGFDLGYQASRTFLDERFQIQQHFLKPLFWKPLKSHSNPLC